MIQDFIQGMLSATVTDKVRPQIQQQARAITLSTPPIRTANQEGDLPYPYPGKGVSGETTN